MINTGGLTPKDLQELSGIMDKVHNVNSTAHELKFEPEPQKETWFDRWVLKWF